MHYSAARLRRLIALLLLAVLPVLGACKVGGAQPAGPGETHGAPVDRPAPRPGDNPTPPPFPRGAEVNPDHIFDVVINGGRIMDPETNFDRIGNVGIDGGKVRAITDQPIRGRETIDATNLIVAPGFIDVLSYAPNLYGIWYKISDGVTTNLGMHGLDWNAAAWFGYWNNQDVPAHYGGAFSILRARERLGLGPYAQATAQQRELLAQMFEQSLHDGYIGIDISAEYAPGITYEDIKALARVAAKYDVPVFFHARYSTMTEPGRTNIEAVQEVIDTARDTGASVHVEHINSTGGTWSMAQSLQMIADARAEGLDVTACVYPYNFWATYLASTRFDPGWQQRFNIDYEDLEIPGSGERLTAATFEKYRATNTLAVAYAIPEEDVRLALQAPFVMLGSDSILEPGNNDHPRATGTFARTLGYYVREEGVISLMEALAKMTIMPAQKLEKHVPALRHKGRLQLGSDADITVFNPDTVRDKGTVAKPDQEAAGIEWVLVSGQIVKTPAGVNKDVRPGKPVTLEVKHPRPTPPVLPPVWQPPPVIEPPPVEPPAEPPVDEPPGDEPPGEPPVDEPPADEPPGDEPPGDGDTPPAGSDPGDGSTAPSDGTEPGDDEVPPGGGEAPEPPAGG